MKKILMTLFILILTVLLGGVAIATTGVVKTNSLNVRDGASTSANSIGTLDTNQVINIISTEGDWYKINYNGSDGYVSKQYVEESANSEEQSETKNEASDENEKSENNDNTNIEKKVESKLIKDANLYVLPLLNSMKISTVSANTEVTVISNNGKWLYIQTEKESGWILSTTLNETDNNKKESDNSNITEEKNENKNETNEIENTEAKNEAEEKNTVSEEQSKEYPVTMYVSGDSVNIRKSPSTSAEVISGTGKNASVKVIDKEGDWYKVETEDGTGYIKSELLSNTKN